MDVSLKTSEKLSKVLMIIIPLSFYLLFVYILSGCIGKVVAWHAAVAHSIPTEVALIYTMHEGGTAHEGGGVDQSIGSTVSDAIVHSWLWLTATRSSPLDCFSNYCK